MARAAVVEAVGASPSGQASSLTETSRNTSLLRASVEAPLLVMETTWAPMRLMAGRIRSISSVSPLLEMAMTTSPVMIIPRSPWIPSAGCRNRAGVPVEAMVEAIFCPTSPDLPMPLTTTLPLLARIRSTARSKEVSMRNAMA